MLDKASIRTDIFSYSLLSILEDNLTDYLITTISNMLALNYAADASLRSSEPNANKYADICAGRIKNFLQEKVVLDETFDVAVEIFAVAITPHVPVTEDLPSMNIIRDQEKASEVIAMAALGVDLPTEELSLLTDVIDTAYGLPDGNDIMNLISSQPDMVKSILRNKKRNKGLSSEEVVHELSKASKNAAKFRSIISDFAQFAGLVACSAMAFVGNIVAVHSFEAIAAAVVIPVSIITLRYGASFGEKLGEKLVEFEGNFKVVQSEMVNILSDIMPGMDLNYAPIRGANIAQEYKIDSGMHKIELGDITKNLASHIDTVSSTQEIADIQKSLKLQQKIGAERER